MHRARRFFLNATNVLINIDGDACLLATCFASQKKEARVLNCKNCVLPKSNCRVETALFSLYASQIKWVIFLEKCYAIALFFKEKRGFRLAKNQLLPFCKGCC